MIPKRADRALAAHDERELPRFARDAAAVICFESGEPVFELIVARLPERRTPPAVRVMASALVHSLSHCLSDS